MGEIRVGSRSVELTNEETVLFPKDGITKGDLINYYAAVAEYMLPHVKGRPLTMHRFPDGLDRDGFFQKNAPEYFPDWVERVMVSVDGAGEKPQVVCENPETLVYLANQACITFHTWLSRKDRLDFPDKMVFDLDPATGDFLTERGAATALRTLLEDELGLTAFLMTTGSRGLHVVVPLDRSAGFDDVREFARNVAAVMESRYPEIFTAEQRIKERIAPVYVDTARNAYGQTSVAPYSVRTIDGAPVALPIAWEELDDLESAQKWTLRDVAQRLSECGDAWVMMEEQICSLDEASDLMAAVLSEVAVQEDNVGGTGS